MDLRRLLARIATPGVLAAALAVVWVAQDAAAAVPWAVVVGGALIAVLEWLTPHTPAWVPGGRALALDTLHAAVTARLVSPAVHALLLLLLTQTGSADGAAWAWLPLPAQVALAVLLADLGAWAAHRAMHLTGWGWRVHAVHHASTSLNLLASARTHPLNAAFTGGAELLPLLALGLPAPALAYWTVIKVVNGLLQHANVHLETGWLDGWWSTARMHRWHHSARLEESNTNFGNTTMVWDRLFGTHHDDVDRGPGVEVGIAGASVPENYLAHLATPWRIDRYRAR